MRGMWLGTGVALGAALAVIPYVSAKDDATRQPIAVPVDPAVASLPTLAPLVKAVEPAVVAIEVHIRRVQDRGWAQR